MSDGTPNYKPGDVVNGHVLTGDMQWVPVAQATQAPVPAAAASKDWSRKGIIVWTLILVFLVFVASGVIRAGQDAHDANCRIRAENPWMGTDPECP